MKITEFREQLKELGLGARKQKGLEALDVTINGSTLCTVTYAELHPIERAIDILEQKRPKHIPEVK